MTMTYKLGLALSGLCLLALLATLSSAAPGASLQSQQLMSSASVPTGSAIAELERVRRESAGKKKEKEEEKEKSKDKDKSRSRDKKAARDCLAAHNNWRKKHGVPELKWDDKIAEFSQKRSEHIAKSDGAEFGHPPDLPFGENLFWHSSSDTACDHMVKGWYDEISLYNFEKPTFDAATGHFTQLIWKTTERVGCALAHSTGKRAGVYLTCNYDPPGNFIGEFEANVPREVGASLASNVTRGTSAITSTQRPTTTLVSSITSTTTTTTTTAAPSTAKPKKKGKGKKKRKKKAESEKEKEQRRKREKEKEKEKKKNKDKKRKKGNKKKTSTTTSTTTSKPESTR